MYLICMFPLLIHCWSVHESILVLSGSVTFGNAQLYAVLTSTCLSNKTCQGNEAVKHRFDPVEGKGCRDQLDNGD